MNNKEFAAKALDIARNYKTSYMLGPWGWACTKAMIDRACSSEANGDDNKGWRSYAEAIKGKGFIFDCVGLIKGILWGWSGDLSKAYGGAGYAINGVPDIGADDMIRRCKDVSTDFKSIAVGEVVWLSGHIGIYIGDGLVVESTPKWKNGVQITAVRNIGRKQGYNDRKWVKHGKLPYITYNNDEEDENMTQEQFNEMMDNYLKDLAKAEPDKWSREAREWAEKNGIIKGDDKGNKMYKKPCTREEMVQILFNLREG